MLFLLYIYHEYLNIVGIIRLIIGILRKYVSDRGLFLENKRHIL
jgi:hypothetical protein